MEVYILDSLLRREKVVDLFESLIWAERFADVGDFELVLHSNAENRGLFVVGTRLAVNNSHYVMVVETVENTTDADGLMMLKVRGRSLESTLDSRVARGSMTDLTTEPNWVLTGTPGDIARSIFTQICITGILDPNDVIPFVSVGTILPDDTIPEPLDPVTLTIEPTTVLSAIKEICALYDLGFRMVRNYDSTQLYFDVYSGSDRTTQQTTLRSVVFQAELDNLQNTTELTTSADDKNVAYVFSPVGFEVVYPVDVDPSVEGFERRVLLVRADDITSTDPTEASTAMFQRGREELSKHRSVYAFDGEIDQRSPYVYGVDYNLGDLVEVRNADGVTNNMRVTEQIFVSDTEGERSYPTLTLNVFIASGTWLAWDYNQVWEDLGTEEFWANA